MRRFATLNLILLIVIILLINLVSLQSFFRIDLTDSGAYSLSEVTRETVSRADDPLQVKVFYSDQVPPPYNGVRRYLLDLLREYEALGRGRFSFEIIDPSTPEGRDEAREYGLQQVEIQEVRSDEFQSRAVHLGVVVLYGSAVEAVDRITGTDGLEYRLTSAMRSAISQVDALAGSPEPVVMHAFISPELRNLQIEGMENLKEELARIHDRINADNYDRLRYQLHEPHGADVDAVAGEFGLQPLVWQDAAGTERQGLLEIVLARGDRLRQVPLEVYSDFFGRYAVQEPEEIEDAVRRGLRTLVAAGLRIGYTTGSGERALGDFQQGAGPFGDLLQERYEVVPVSLDAEPVPADINTLIVNGPRRAFSETALYRIDQFVMDGGSLLVFHDHFEEEMPTQQEMMFGAQPEWRPISTGLGPMLAHYGLDVSDELVLDEAGFVATSQGRRVTIFQAPVLTGASLNRESVITRGLEDVIVLNATEIRRSGRDRPGQEDDRAGSARFIPLLETSPRSWTVEHPADAGPWLEGVPPGVTPDRRTVAAILEGSFESYFSAPPESETESETDSDTNDGEFRIRTDRYRSRSARDGRIMVVSTSEVTTAQLLDPRNRTPNGTFLLNAVDYLAGAPAFAELRSKGLGVARLEIANPAVPGIVRWTNVILVPALVIAVGLVVRLRRRARSRWIQAIFSEERDTV